MSELPASGFFVLGEFRGSISRDGSDYVDVFILCEGSFNATRLQVKASSDAGKNLAGLSAGEHVTLAVTAPRLATAKASGKAFLGGLLVTHVESAAPVLPAGPSQ